VSKPIEICVQQTKILQIFSNLTFLETTPIGPQIRALLQLPNSTPIFLSSRGCLLPGNVTPLTLNPTTDIITVHQNELQTLWKNSSSTCGLSLLHDMGTDSMNENPAAGKPSANTSIPPA